MKRAVSQVVGRSIEALEGVDLQLTAYSHAQGIRVIHSPFSPLAVNYPVYVSHADVLRFVQGTQLFARAKQIVRNPIENAIQDGHMVYDSLLRFVPCLVDACSSEPTRSGYNIYYPVRRQINSYPVQRYAFEVLKEMALYEGRKYIPALVEVEAERLGLEFSQVRVRAMDRRWGSCSSKRVLHFSSYLMLSSKEALRYTVLHELAHLTYLDHGAAFWALLTEYLGEDAIAVDKRIRNAKLGIPTVY